MIANVEQGDQKGPRHDASTVDGTPKSLESCAQRAVARTLEAFLSSKNEGRSISRPNLIRVFLRSWFAGLRGLGVPHDDPRLYAIMQSALEILKALHLH